MQLIGEFIFLPLLNNIMKRTAVFPGSFDPVTKGHQSIVNRSLDLFDEIVIAVGTNINKRYYFTEEQRMKFLKQTFEGKRNIRIDSYKGLTIDYCQNHDIRHFLRGLRTSADFEFERSIAQVNKALNNQVETVFILATPGLSAINSTIVRDILRNGGDVRQFIPENIKLI